MATSDLEREFELEFEGQADPDEELDDSDEELDDSDEELDVSDEELDDDELDDEDHEVSRAALADDYDERGWDPDRYAQRFYELASRSFESETELDGRINEILNDMEREYLFGGLLKKLKKAGSGLLKKGMSLAKNLPIGKALQGVTQLARGNLKGMLGSLAKAALSSGLIPGGGMVLPALSALGFGGGDQSASGAGGDAAGNGFPGDGGGGMLPWQNLVDLIRDSYGQLANELNENAHDPVEASGAATRAFQTAMHRARRRAPGNGRTRRIKLRPGETLIIEG